jgi:hypothetical protein
MNINKETAKIAFPILILTCLQVPATEAANLNLDKESYCTDDKITYTVDIATRTHGITKMLNKESGIVYSYEQGDFLPNSAPVVIDNVSYGLSPGEYQLSFTPRSGLEPYMQKDFKIQHCVNGVPQSLNVDLTQFNQSTTESKLDIGQPSYCTNDKITYTVDVPYYSPGVTRVFNKKTGMAYNFHEGSFVPDVKDYVIGANFGLPNGEYELRFISRGYAPYMAVDFRVWDCLCPSYLDPGSKLDPQ